MIAAENNDVNRLIFAFINGFDLSKPGYEDITLLHMAAAKGNLETIVFLISKAKVPSEPLDHSNRTPLDYALKHGHQGISASFLISNKFLRSASASMSHVCN